MGLHAACPLGGNCSDDRLRAVFTSVMGGAAKGAADVDPARAMDASGSKPGSKKMDDAHADEALPTQPDDPQQEEQAAYRIKIGRWKSESTQVINDSWFWAILRIQRDLHEPFEHHFSFLKAKQKTGDGPMANLVCGKAYAILHEYDGKLRTGSFLEPAVSKGLPVDAQLILIECAVELFANHCCGYDRRVLSECTKFPFRLQWLAHAPPETECPHRKWIGNLIVSMPPQALELNTAKLLGIFGKKKFQHVAETGKCPEDLYAVGVALRKSQRADVMLNESHNSLIKSIATTCRRIGLPLLSARCNVKRELGVGSRGASQRWSLLRCLGWG